MIENIVKHIDFIAIESTYNAFVIEFKVPEDLEIFDKHQI